MLVFEERGKPEYLEKNLLAQGRDQQTQPTYEAKSGNRTQATLVGGECSHHCATRLSYEARREQVVGDYGGDCGNVNVKCTNEC